MKNMNIRKHSNSGGAGGKSFASLKHLVVKAVKKFSSKSESSKGVIDVNTTPKKVKEFNNSLGSNKSNGKIEKKK